MKLFLIIIILVWIPAIALPAFASLAFAGQSDSVAVDTIRNPEDYSILLSGSVGFATTYNLDREFSNAPAIGIGVEIPFDDYHLIGFEVMAHTWIAEYTGNGPISYSENGQSIYYENLYDDYYSQLGWSIGLKGYTAGNDAFCRVSYHFGYVLSPDNDYFAWDLGLGLNFNFSENYYISLNRRFMITLTFAGDSLVMPVPGFYFLNISRKF